MDAIAQGNDNEMKGFSKNTSNITFGKQRQV
jgi:hypothetical protein